MNSVVFLINSKVLLFHIAHIWYSYYKVNVLTLVICKFIKVIKCHLRFYIWNILLPFCLNDFWYLDLFSLLTMTDPHNMLSWASLCFVTVLITFCFYFLLYSFTFVLWVKCVNHLVEKKDALHVLQNIVIRFSSAYIFFEELQHN